MKVAGPRMVMMDGPCRFPCRFCRTLQTRDRLQRQPREQLGPALDFERARRESFENGGVGNGSDRLAVFGRGLAEPLCPQIQQDPPGFVGTSFFSPFLSPFFPSLFSACLDALDASFFQDRLIR